MLPRYNVGKATKRGVLLNSMNKLFKLGHLGSRPFCGNPMSRKLDLHFEA